MIINYKNYTIQDDNSGFSLSETKIIDKGPNAGKQTSTQIYPSTLERAFSIIFKKENIKKNDTLDLKNAINHLNIIQVEFIQDLKEIAKEFKIN